MHCITFAFSHCFMYYRCVFTMLKSYVLVGLDWAEPMMYLLLHVTCSYIFHAYVPFLSFLLIRTVFGTFLRLSPPLLSLSLSRLVYSWHLKRASLLRPGTLFVSGHHLLPLLILSPLMSGSMMIKLVRTFWRTFLDAAFIRKCQVILSDFFYTNLPTVIHSRGWEFLCDISVTCPSVIMQEFYSKILRFDYSLPHFITRVRGTCIVVTPDLISEVLHILRVSHPDYPGCPRLRTVSKGELSSLFCETPSSWGERC